MGNPQGALSEPPHSTLPGFRSRVAPGSAMPTFPIADDGSKASSVVWQRLISHQQHERATSRLYHA